MGRPHNVCRRRPQDVGGGRPMALHIVQYGNVRRMLLWDVLRTSYFNVLRAFVEDVLRTSVRDVPWRYIEDHMETSIGRLLGTSSGRPRDVILPSALSLFHTFRKKKWQRIIQKIWEKNCLKNREKIRKKNQETAYGLLTFSITNLSISN